MDIAKYIGLFLLKNNYCCLQGMGNLEIRKRPASQQEGQLNAPYYEAVFNQTGSIDDALANFIATNESVSIAKASNEIREFISYTKAELAAGNEVPIPSVGKYIPGSNGVVRFELDPAFSMPAKPVPVAAPVRPVPQPVSASSQESSRQSNVNWGLITMWAVILLVVGSILFFGIRYMTQRPSPSADQTSAADNQMVEVTAPADTVAVTRTDSTASAVAMPASAADTPGYNFVISTYKSLASAQRREKQLNGYGHNVSLVTMDSVSFYVVKKMRILPADTLHMKDSLTKVLNPSGVTIMQ